MLRSEASLLDLIGKALRADFEDTKRQPLPKRWVDLIRHLDEQERRQSHSSAEPGLAAGK
jgi:hypothetical protein